MFKQFVITFIAMFALTQAYSNPNDVNAQILNYNNQVNDDGSYNYAYDSSNGIAVQETGVGGYYASGGYSYYSPEGEFIQLSVGNALPTPPLIPPQILKALEYIRTHPKYDESPQSDYNSFVGKRRFK